MGLEKRKSKKMKKKHDKSPWSQSYTTNNREDEKLVGENEIYWIKSNGSIHSTNDYISNNCTNKKKIYQKNELLDTIENCSLNNEKIESKKTKKKKKHNTNVYSQDSVITCSKDENITVKNNVVGSIESLNNFVSNSMTKKKNHQNYELLDDNCGINNENVNWKKTKKKKKRNKSFSSQDITYNNRKDEKMFEKNEEESIGSLNDLSFNECVIKKKKKRSHELLDISLYDNLNINENIESKRIKKKKYNHVCSQDSVTTSIVNETVVEQNEIGSIQRTNNHVSNDCINKIKKNQNQVLLDILLDDSSSKNNENVELKKTKKKKKNKSLLSQDSVTTYGTDEIKKNENQVLLDTLLDDSSSKNNENVELKKTKKKEKNKSLLSQDSATTYSTDEIKKNENQVLLDTLLDDSSSKNSENVELKKTKKKKKNKSLLSQDSATTYGTDEIKKNENQVLLDTLLDDSSSKNNENVELKKTKKKEKNKSLLSQDSATTYSTDEIKKNENQVLLDTLLDDSNSKNSENVELKKTKKNKSLLSQDSATTYSTDEIKKNENQVLLDTLLDDSNSKNNENVELKKTKKKKKNKSLLSQDSATTYSTDENKVKTNVVGSIESINNYASNDLTTKEKELQNQKLLDTSLDCIDGTNSENVELIKSKNNEEHTKCTLDVTTINTTKETISKRKRQSSESSLDSFIAEPIIYSAGIKRPKNTKNQHLSSQIVKDDFYSIIGNIKFLQQKLIQSYEINNHQNADNFCDDDYNYLTDDTNSNNNNHGVSQENPDFKTFLNTIEKYRNENLSINTEPIALNISNLINVISTNKSLMSHSNFGLILNKLTKEFKKLLKTGQIMVVNSDMILLRIIGEKILEKLIERQNNIEIVKNLRIKNVSPGGKKNGMHYTEASLAKYPSKSLMQVLKKINPSIKLGQFNKEEDNIIKKYWSKFQKEYNISDVGPFLTDFLAMALPRSERLHFARFISAELPDRLLYTVYFRFNTLFNKQLDQLKFMEEEDDLIMQVINCEAIKTKYAVLCLLLKRTKYQVVRRYSSLTLKPSRNRRINWDDDKRELLFKSILLETNTNNWKNLKNMTIKKKEWIKIGEHFDEPIGYDKARTQWKFLSTMLFCKTRITKLTLRLTVLQLLLQTNPKCWSDLNWVEITNKLYPGADSRVINTIFHGWVTSVVPSRLRSNLKESLIYLSSQVDLIANEIENDKDKVIPRFNVINDNELVEIYE